MSQHRLARTTDIPYSRIRAIEQGQHDLSLDALDRIAEALSVEKSVMMNLIPL